MSSPFENYLEEIAEEVSTPVDKKDIDMVISHVVNKLRRCNKDFNCFFCDSISIGK